MSAVALLIVAATVLWLLVALVIERREEREADRLSDALTPDAGDSGKAYVTYSCDGESVPSGQTTFTSGAYVDAMFDSAIPTVTVKFTGGTATDLVYRSEQGEQDLHV